MTKSDERRQAVKDIGEAYRKHIVQTGGQPNSREIERRVADIGRRGDRQDSDRKK